MYHCLVNPQPSTSKSANPTPNTHHYQYPDCTSHPISVCRKTLACYDSESESESECSFPSKLQTPTTNPTSSLPIPISNRKCLQNGKKCQSKSLDQTQIRPESPQTHQNDHNFSFMQRSSTSDLISSNFLPSFLASRNETHAKDARKFISPINSSDVKNTQIFVIQGFVLVAEAMISTGNAKLEKKGFEILEKCVDVLAEKNTKWNQSNFEVILELGKIVCIFASHPRKETLARKTLAILLSMKIDTCLLSVSACVELGRMYLKLQQPFEALEMFKFLIATAAVGCKHSNELILLVETLTEYDFFDAAAFVNSLHPFHWSDASSGRISQNDTRQKFRSSQIFSGFLI
eukprot:Sdes_comp19916_c0_seq1m12340